MNPLLSALRPLVVLPALALPAVASAQSNPAPPQLPPQQAPKADGGKTTGRPLAPQEQAERLRAAELRQWFEELDDADAAVREAARLKLMGMRREDLPAFKKLVQDSLPLMPSQAAVLRQIVSHVFLTGEKYATTQLEGFLGVRMQETSVRLPGADSGDAFAPAVGVVVVERYPGFAGGRMLVDGDVILGIVERPDVRTLGTYEFTMVIKAVTPGTTVHLQVMRQGQIMRVPVAPDPRPFEADGLMPDLIKQRQHEAEKYWDREFAPLVKEGVG